MQLARFYQRKMHYKIEQFLTNNVDAKLEPLPFTAVEGSVGYQFLPTENGGDGFYYAKLRKVVS